jgi:hypothetical protein
MRFWLIFVSLLCLAAIVRTASEDEKKGEGTPAKDDDKKGEEVKEGEGAKDSTKDAETPAKDPSKESEGAKDGPKEGETPTKEAEGGKYLFNFQH